MEGRVSMRRAAGSRAAVKGLMLAATALGLTAALSGTAVAQEVAAAPVAADGESGDGEILVTARRRAESLLEVPIAINVVSGDQIQQDGITRTEDLQFLVPGLSVVSFIGGANVSLRGVGTGQNVSGTDESVGIYLDEIFQGVGSAAFSRFFDVERVEVLKGPQGTLYGRNVTAGAISLVSRAPVLGKLGGEVDASYGTYDTFRANAAINVPLGDNAALRVSGTFGDSRGYVRDIVNDDYLNGEDYFGARVRLLVETSDKVSIDAGIQYLKDDTPFAWEALDTEASWIGYGQVRTPSEFIFATDETVNANVRATLRFTDELSARWISGYFWQSGFNSVIGPSSISDPADGARQTDRTRYEQLTQEVQLQWERGGSSVVAGAYYLSASGVGQRAIDFNLFGLPNYQNAIGDDATDAFALFGEAQIAVTEQLKLIGGLRYNTEDRRLLNRAGDPPGLTDPAEPLSGEASFSSTTGRVGASFQATDEAFFYATVSKGFKSGGVQDLGGVIGRFDPETLWAYEGGVKYALPRGGALELSLFQYDYDDLQVFQVVNLFDFQVVNAAKARVRGIDASARVRLGDNFGINLSGNYLDAKYREFIYRGAGGVEYDLAGERLARAPEFTLTSQLVIDNWSVFGLDGAARGEINYRDDQFTTVGSPESMEAASLEAVTLINFNLDFSPAGDSGFGFFGNARNLTDERYYEFSGGGGIIGGVLAKGRTFEVGVRARF